MKQKVGTEYNQPKNKNQPIIHSNIGDFVSIVDGITFGVQNGYRFHSAHRDWSQEGIESWAFANAIFFETVAKNLRAFAKATNMKSEKI